MQTCRLLRVEVARQQRDQGVEGCVGAVAVGGENDLLAVRGTERHDAEDARRVDRVLARAGDLDVEAGVARRLDEEGGRDGRAGPTDEAMVTVRVAMEVLLGFGAGKVGRGSDGRAGIDGLEVAVAGLEHHDDRGHDEDA